MLINIIDVFTILHIIIFVNIFFKYLYNIPDFIYLLYYIVSIWMPIIIRIIRYIICRYS